jgi:GMP synthase (glutamine-hydrolysing)
MILIIDLNHKGSLGYQEFVRPLEEIIGEQKDCTACHYSQVTSVQEYEGIVLSGTALKDHGYLRDLSWFGWLHSVTVPVLGICAGMQVIGLMFSSTLIPCTEIGMVEIRPMEKNRLIQSLLSVYELHTHGITPSHDFIPIARSDTCIQGIKHREKAMYGVLFHPEVRNHHIIREFLTML